MPRTVLALLCLFGSGCVQRYFVVDSSPRQAMVYVNNVPYGPSPATVPFTYYGKYDITLVREGFQSETFAQKVEAPWYAYPPIDFFAEVLNPFKVEDVHRFHFDLKPAVPPDPRQLEEDGRRLREDGRAVPDPKYPYEPRTKRREREGQAPPPKAGSDPGPAGGPRFADRAVRIKKLPHAKAQRSQRRHEKDTEIVFVLVSSLRPLRLCVRHLLR